MKRILLTAFIIISIQSFSQEHASAGWYKMFAGKINNQPLTMHIHKADHGYSGYYYYDQQQKPVYFTGDDTTVKGKVQLGAWMDPEVTEYFSFVVSDGALAGNWKKTEKGKPVDFSLAEVKMPKSFMYVFTSGVTKLRPKLKGSPESSFEAESIWPEGNNPADSFLKRMIRREFLAERSNKDIGIILVDDKKNHFKSYLEDNKNEKDKDILEMLTRYSSESSQKLMIFYRSGTMLGLSNYDFEYYGGAHGMYGISYVNIDLVHRKELALQDVLTKDGIKKLRPLLEKTFRVQMKLKPTDPLEQGGLLVDKIEPSKNFYLTGKGIGFGYNPYEIGSFAMGAIDIFIPYTELAAYLQPGFKTLIK
ncbi:MAG: DUF3298 domain-containing protein [Flavisolibacter sp.]